MTADNFYTEDWGLILEGKSIVSTFCSTFGENIKTLRGEYVSTSKPEIVELYAIVKFEDPLCGWDIYDSLEKADPLIQVVDFIPFYSFDSIDEAFYDRMREKNISVENLTQFV
jgi:hypothetical protein